MIRKDSEKSRRQKRRGKGRSSYFKLPSRSTSVRLIPGEYKVYDETVRPYFVKFTRYDVLEGRVRDAQGNQCLMQWHNDNVSGDKPRFGKLSQKNVYNLVHLADYELVEERNEKTGQEYTVKKLIEDNRRRKAAEDGREVIFGKKLYWTLNEEDHAILMAYDKELFSHCAGCGEGEIYVVSYECEKCMQELLNAEESSLSMDEIIDFGDRDQRCSSCGFEGLPVAITDGAIEKEGEWTKCCEDARPANIFDVNLEVKGVPRSARSGNKTFMGLQITGHTVGAVDERLEEMIQPYDFDSMFDLDLPTQSKFLSVPIPPEFGESGSSSVSYD